MVEVPYIHDMMLVIRGSLAKKIQVPQPYLCNDNDDLPAAVPENTNVTYPISPLLPLILFCTLGFSIMFAAIICEKWGAVFSFLKGGLMGGEEGRSVVSSHSSSVKECDEHGGLGRNFTQVCVCLPTTASLFSNKTNSADPHRRTSAYV